MTRPAAAALHQPGTILRCPQCGYTLVCTGHELTAICTGMGRHKAEKMTPVETCASDERRGVA